MSDLMRGLPLKELIRRMFEEYKASKSIFGIREDQFFRKSSKRAVKLSGDTCETLLGPAAGPHSQLAQNIVVSYLTGSRFIELKTVQIMDQLEIAKPCIDASDEGFNTEWSTELTLEGAYDEYLRAWLVLHVLEAVFDLKIGSGDRSFVFNMSVGYDLEGIKKPKMQAYINDMMDSSHNSAYQAYVKDLVVLAADGSFLSGTGLENRVANVKRAITRIRPQICRSVTLSTMHGCPPHEIEAICAYMLTEKKIDTYVKLNPTLLTYDVVRSILDKTGFDDVTLNPDSFSHDLQYDDALAMLKRLRALASDNKRFFGVKLTNTLGSVNDKGALPGDEMYMSGRALFPLSINLAAKLSKEFNGDLPISYAGGLSMANLEALFETGIYPLTLATDVLKPGGYARFKQMAELLENKPNWGPEKIDVEKLSALAASVFDMAYALKETRDGDDVGVPGALPLSDCYVAPCIEACAIHQDIPEYIRLVGNGQYADAIQLIYERNALPSITGHICDHQCQLNCTRLDYEEAVKIREIKRIAWEQGLAEYKKKMSYAQKRELPKVAVVGAGPSGLSSAYFLAREGFDVTVFDENDSAGGIVGHVIPAFRIPEGVVESDIQFIKDHGVKFEFGMDRDFHIKDFQGKGFDYVLLATGTHAVRTYTLEGDNTNIISSLEFLKQFAKAGDSLKLGETVAVVGAGDTAMDAARAALRVPGVKHSMIIYRRAKKQMPASREEYLGAVDDGIEFHWLRNPVEFHKGSKLVCAVMELGEKDASGRRSPVATGKTEEINVDTLIYSIGDLTDIDLLQSAGLAADAKGKPELSAVSETKQKGVFLVGDAKTGPSTIVHCISEARKIADEICRREMPDWKRSEFTVSFDTKQQLEEIKAKKGQVLSALPINKDFQAFAKQEALRCLECNYICNKCVEVCPNRANMAIAIADSNFRDAYQIIHIDAYCNECGNCGYFCPWEGRPYKDKTTVFSSLKDFTNSENPGFFVDASNVHIRFSGKTAELAHNAGQLQGAAKVYTEESDTIEKIFSCVVNEHSYLFGEVKEIM